MPVACSSLTGGRIGAEKRGNGNPIGPGFHFLTIMESAGSGFAFDSAEKVFFGKLEKNISHTVDV